MTHQKVTNKLPTGCQQVTNFQPTVGKNFGLKHNKSCRQTVSQLLVDYWPTVGWLLANCWPTDGRQSADSWPTISFKTVLHFYPKLYYTPKTFLNHRTPSLTRVFSNCYKKKNWKRKRKKKTEKETASQ